MSPITINPDTGADFAYASPFVGPINHTESLAVPLSGLTADEIDAKGWLKPGVPLTKAGALVAVETVSTPGAFAAAGGNTGNGTVTGVSGRFGAPAETITLTAIIAAANGGTFRVEGSQSGNLGNAVVGVAFNSGTIGFTINDGATDFVVGDKFTSVVVGGVMDAVRGVTVEPVKVADDNESATIAGLGTVHIAVATIAQVNKDVIEDILDRSLTAAEIAGFDEPGCSVKLIA
jgi:hypothetical protein